MVVADMFVVWDVVERRYGNFRVLFAGKLPCNGSGIVEENEAKAS